jgi:hypothetical protein
MTRVRPFTRLGRVARWIAGPHLAEPVEWQRSVSRKSSETFRFGSATTQSQVPGRPTDEKVRAGRRAECRWEWRSHGANGCAGRARTMFILQPVRGHPRRAVPTWQWGSRSRPAAATDPAGPAPEPLVSVTSTLSWRPLKGRDGGNRTLYPQITSLMLYPNELHHWST